MLWRGREYGRRGCLKAQEEGLGPLKDRESQRHGVECSQRSSFPPQGGRAPLYKRKGGGG